MPLVGSSPSTTLMFTSAWTAIIAVRPSARNDPNASCARIAMRTPRHAMTQKHSEHGRRAEQAKLFADHGVDEVGVRFGKEEQLLNAAHQSAAEHAAGADGDQRLHDLEAISQRIGFRIQEREEPAQSIRRAGDQEIQHRHGGQRRADEIPVVQSGREDHRADDHQQRGGGAEIRLQQDQPAHRADDDGDGQQRVRELVDAVHAALERQRREQHGRNLGELRRLDAEAAED